MIDELYGVLLLLVIGVLFDQLIIVLLRSAQERNITIFLLTMLNNLVIFLVLFVCYLVDGYIVRAQWGEGWLDWVTLVEGFLAAYLPVSLAFSWRVITRREM